MQQFPKIYRPNLSPYNTNKSEEEKLAEAELRRLIYGPGGSALAQPVGDGSPSPKPRNPPEGFVLPSGGGWGSHSRPGASLPTPVPGAASADVFIGTIHVLGLFIAGGSGVVRLRASSILWVPRRGERSRLRVGHQGLALGPGLAERRGVTSRLASLTSREQPCDAAPAGGGMPEERCPPASRNGVSLPGVGGGREEKAQTWGSSPCGCPLVATARVVATSNRENRADSGLCDRGAAASHSTGPEDARKSAQGTHRAYARRMQRLPTCGRGAGQARRRHVLGGGQEGARRCFASRCARAEPFPAPGREEPSLEQVFKK